MKHGAGVLRNSRGVYDGAWAHGLQDGDGSWTASPAVVAACEAHHVVGYAGGWRGGRHHGRGRATHKDGTYFAGGFDDGVQHGAGCTKTYANGDVYVGDVVRGGFEGEGTYRFAATATAYTGAWLHSCRHGEGSYTYPVRV